MEQRKSSIDTIPQPPEDVLKMYEISGQEQITDHDMDRYIRDKVQNDEVIRTVLQKRREIESEPLIQRIQDGLANPNPELQTESAELIENVSAEQALPLLEQCLIHSNHLVRCKAATMAWRLPDELRIEYVKKCLMSNDLEIYLYAALSISPEIEEGYKSELNQIIEDRIKSSIESGNEEMQNIIVKSINCLRTSGAKELLLKCLSSQNSEVRMIGIRTINQTKDIDVSEKIKLFKVGMEDPDIMVQKQAIASMRFLSFAKKLPKSEIDYFNQEVAKNVRKGISNPDPKIRREALDMLDDVLNSDRKDLILECMYSDDQETRISGARLITKIPEADMQYVYIALKAKVREGLLSKDNTAQIEAVKLIAYCSGDDKEHLIDLVIKEGLSEHLITPPLYNNDPEINDKDFSRSEFKKTGSKTTLIGGPLKSKVIVRKIEPEPFTAWQKLYENWSAWRDNGFDYVPIEPIHSFNLGKKDELVNVYSGVLDLSLREWNKLTERFSEKLEEQGEKIKKVLDRLKVEHGHPHTGNLCLRFFRDKDGIPDLTKVPRVYLIDFDKSTPF